MTEKRRVVSSTSTHSQGTVKQGSSEFKVTNNQNGMLLIDPEDVESGSTHSWNTPKTKGARKAPTTAAVRDEERPTGGRTAQIPNEKDPAAGYLETESGMPVIDNSIEAGDADGMDDGDEGDLNIEEFAEEEVTADDATGDDVEADIDEDDVDELEAEFEDLGDLEGEEGVEAEFDDMESLGNPEADEVDSDTEDAITEVQEEAALPFEEEVVGVDDVSLLDADAVAEEDDTELLFATTQNAVHVIRANRIIASMGPASARKSNVSDLYLTDQFQDVVQASIEQKGLRKGLVQAGFILAKVKLGAASKATNKAIEAKVEARIVAKVAAMERKDEALEQSLAIAAVGINRRYFKDASNELRSALENELSVAGVRGASRMISAAFQKHGVDYAKSILTLARKLSAMPDEVRNQYAEALDLTSDEDYEVDEVDSEVDSIEDFTEEEDISPSSVTAALLQPARRSQPVFQSTINQAGRTAALLKAGVSANALSILSSDIPLV